MSTPPSWQFWHRSIVVVVACKKFRVFHPPNPRYTIPISRGCALDDSSATSAGGISPVSYRISMTPIRLGPQELRFIRSSGSLFGIVCAEIAPLDLFARNSTRTRDYAPVSPKKNFLAAKFSAFLLSSFAPLSASFEEHLT